jgi:hypothetical protein
MEARHEARFSTVRKLAATLGVEPSALAEYLGRPARGDCFAHASRPSFRFAFIALIRVHYGGNCAHTPACGGAASDGATHGGGRISVTKNGAVCAAIAVDEKQRVHLILYGTQGTIGLSPLADFLQQAGIAAVDAADPALVLTAGTSGSTLDMVGGPAANANVIVDTSTAAGPSMTFYKQSQNSVLALAGSADGHASATIRGSFLAIDGDGNAAWQAP